MKDLSPRFRRTRREALVAFLLWLGAGTWTVTACVLLGYDRPAEPVWGIPGWIVWGVFLPWLTFFILHTWYSLFFLRDDDSTRTPKNPKTRGH